MATKTLRTVTFAVKVNPAINAGLADVVDLLKTFKGVKAGVENAEARPGGKVAVTLDASGWKPKKFAKAVYRYTCGNVTLTPDA